LHILKQEQIDLVITDIVMPPGESLIDVVDSANAGIYLIKQILTNYSKIHVFCLSGRSRMRFFEHIETKRFGEMAHANSVHFRFLEKGEFLFRPMLDEIRSALASN